MGSLVAGASRGQFLLIKLSQWQRFDWLVVLMALAFLHSVTWGATISRVGFFTDEWELFGILHFVPHNLFDDILRVLQHERFTVRPLLACLLGALYYCFGDQPYGYHFLNQIVEIFGAFFLYLAVAQLTKLKLPAFISAVFFLLYPNHDISHYHVTAISAQIALSLFTLTFYLFVLGVQRDDKRCLCLALVLYGLSLPIYELGLPLFVLLAAAAVWVYCLQRGFSLRKSVIRAAYLCLPYLFLVAIFVLFRMVLLPTIGSSTVYKSGFQIDHVVSVFREGMMVSVLPPAFLHFCGKAYEAVLAGLSRTLCWQLLLVTLLMILPLVAAGEKQIESLIHNRKTLVVLMAFGLLAVLVGYTPYALAPDYLPVLDSGYNRINQASSIGASLFLASLLCLFYCVLKTLLATTHKAVPALVLASTVAALVNLFILADWQYSKAWMASTAMQNRIISQVRQFAPAIKASRTLILTGTPRYVLWAPLFDSVWDFQSMLRIVLNDQAICGGVTSSRMRIMQNKLKDMHGEAVIWEYGFDHMLVLVPDLEHCSKVDSAEAFVNFVEKNGVKFDLDQQTVDRWRSELRNSGN